MDEHLEELARLADTAGAQVVGTLTQQLDRPHPGTYLGSGKVEELKHRIQELGATLVIFDDELTPAQGKNVEQVVRTRVMDRAEAAILDAPPRVVAGARDMLAKRFDRHLADLEGSAYTIVSALLDASLERARAEGIDLDDGAQLESLVDDSGPVMRAQLERVVHDLYDDYRLAADGVAALLDRLSSGGPLSPEDERRREILVSGLALVRKLESDPGRAPLQGLLRGEAPRP